MSRARETFLAAIAVELTDGLRRTLSESLEFGRFLLRSEATLRRLNEARASRPVTEAEEERAEKLRRRVQEACLERGLGVRFSSGPGGSAIRLALPSNRTNDFGRGGYCDVP